MPSLRRLQIAAVLLAGATQVAVKAQAVADTLAPLNGFSAGAEFSNDSTHIILGQAYDRRLAGLDLTYSRRVGRRRGIVYTWDIELRPIAYLQDPVQTTNVTVTAQNGATVFRSLQSMPALQHCHESSFSGPIQIVSPTGLPMKGQFNAQNTCSTRWTYSGGISPVGQRLNLLPSHRLQPYLLANGGLLVATRYVPVNNSSYFNFTFDFGSGLEWFTGTGSAWSVDYRVQHMSNKKLGVLNPGVDSQLFRVAYTIGKLPFRHEH